MRTRASAALFAATVFAAQFLPAIARADQICFERGGQFSALRHCVTSVRPSESGANFGPDHLAAADDSAWCAAAERDQAITLYLNPPAPLRTISFTNGYAKSPETFRRNGRIRRALIETSTGYQGYIDPKDTPASQRFIIAKGTYAWVRLKILETARGTANANPCASEFLVNLEELGNN
jgi:hypothetical protein